MCIWVQGGQSIHHLFTHFVTHQNLPSEIQKSYYTLESFPDILWDPQPHFSLQRIQPRNPFPRFQGIHNRYLKPSKKLFEEAAIVSILPRTWVAQTRKRTFTTTLRTSNSGSSLRVYLPILRTSFTLGPIVALSLSSSSSHSLGGETSVLLPEIMHLAVAPT